MRPRPKHLARILWLACCVVACVWALLLANPARAQSAHWPGTVEAAPSSWDATEPPATGWVSASLPNDWNQHWPGHDGVVWYRLRWDMNGAPSTQGLFIHYLMYAAVISVNGVELQRDPHLTEPLTRSWNTPRFLVLPAPLLHTGSNTLMIRVAGYYAYQPALGEVELGAVEPMRAAYQHSVFMRQSLQWLNLGIGSTLGCFFLALWLMRRKETAYGWYGLQQMAWFVFSFNFINTSTWPFQHTDTYAAVTSVAYVVYHGCNAMFVLRFMGCRWPRRERALWALIAITCLAMLIAPHEYIRAMRSALAWVSTVLLFITSGVFLHLAWRQGNGAQRILSITGAITALAMAHDLLVFLRLVDSNFYLVTYAETISTIGIALGLAWNFVNNTRRIEHFNDDMHQRVTDARTELATSLARQHDLELLHARLGERVNLAHDLHDGLGGMLIGNITTVERKLTALAPDEVLDMLRSMRDDLRLIIDTASAQHYGELSLAELLAPLRHRMSRLFELHDIDVHWRTQQLDQVQMSTTQSLDVLRILQEALTNVFKHSRASLVQVDFAFDGQQLLLQVHDNGIGLPNPPANAAQGSAGTGLLSMQARAQRLGASLQIQSGDGATVVRLRMPWPGQPAQVQSASEQA